MEPMKTYLVPDSTRTNFVLTVTKRVNLFGSLMTGKKQFDETEVLAQISDHFWEHGYGATRVDQLSALTGLTKTSLYNAFGNKESLFLKSLDFYVEQGLNLRMRQIDPSRPLSENLQLILESAFLRKNNEKLSYGCFLTNSILELAGSEPRLQEEASKRYDQSCVAIRQLFALYVDTKRLAPGIGVDDLTDMFMTFKQGLRVQSRNRHPDEVIQRSIRTYINLMRSIELEETS